MARADDLNRLHDVLRAESKIAFFTGAGISTESGIDDFRSPGGVWSRMKPIQFSDFMADEEVRLEDWRRRFRFKKQFEAVEPNAGHLAMAQVVGEGRGLGVTTQNIDGLHQRAGVAAEVVVEIHGNGLSASCLECGTPVSFAEAERWIDAMGIAPRCEVCGGFAKADVVSFGQAMPEREMERAVEMALASDWYVVCGSSLVVQPAASLPLIAKRGGAGVAIVNREATAIDEWADIVVHGEIGASLGGAFATLDR